MKKIIKKISIEIYRITLMPYFERDRYFQELADDIEKNDIPKILSEINKEKIRGYIKKQNDKRI